MKKIKAQAVYLAALWIVGLTMLLCSFLNEGSSQMMTGIGTALVVVCTINLLKLWRISKNPEAIKQMEVMQNEERLEFIANKAARATLHLVVALQYIALIVAVFLHKDEIASALGFVVCGQLLVYVFFSRYYSKKY